MHPRRELLSATQPSICSPPPSLTPGITRTLAYMIVSSKRGSPSIYHSIYIGLTPLHLQAIVRQRYGRHIVLDRLGEVQV